MPPTILSSPLLSLPGIKTILLDPSLSKEDRIRVLSAKISLLQNDPSTTLPRLATRQTATQSTTSSSVPSVGIAGGQSGPTVSGRGEAEAGPSRAFGPVPPTTFELLDTRLDLARTYLSLSPAPKYTEAESELTLVDGEAKRLVKAMERQAALAAKAAGEAGEATSVAREGTGDLRKLKRTRIQALELLVGVEGGLGREGRAKRCKETLDKLRTEV